MVRGVAGFFGGNWLVLHLPVLPDFALAYCLVPIACCCLFMGRLRLLAGFALGIVYTFTVASGHLARVLPTHLEGADLEVTGVVAEHPQVQDGIARLMLEVTDLSAAPQMRGGTLVLSWYGPDRELRAGTVIRAVIRANRPSGSVNFGLFDYEAWLFANRICGRGYFRSAPEVVRESSRLLPRLRGWVRDALEARFREPGLIQALVLGDTSHLDPEAWRLILRTGVVHLVIVSGMHLSIVAGLVLAVCSFLGASLPARVACTIAATTTYALLSGWGLPVQRALIMVTVLLLCLIAARQITAVRQMSIALLACLLHDPLATLQNGFWLSFGAVAVLVFLVVQARLGQGNPVTRYVRLAVQAQWMLFVALLPVLLTLTGQFSLVAILVNLLAVPFVGLVIIPVFFVTAAVLAVAPAYAMHLVGLSEFLTSALWESLRFAASEHALVQRFPPPSPIAALATLGAVLILAPLGAPMQVAGFTALASLAAKGPDEPALDVTFLDVGQGLSVILETRLDVTLYDTGPAFGTRYSAASGVVLPTLAKRGWRALDNLIISHHDNDHAGGASEVMANMPVTSRLITPASCHGAWESAGVLFKVIRPSSQGSSNNLSCMLLAVVGEQSFLLTGDIEVEAEREVRDSLYPVTVMSAPHHGSDTSSSPGFLNRLRPELVVVSSGYRNRFDHPSPEVLRRYEARHIRVLDTARDGAIRISFADGAYVVQTARSATQAIWRR